MELTLDAIVALAPDAAVAAAGRKLATTRGWQNLGRNDRALWGECQGSALYQVRVDCNDLTTRCSCPSRKFPCKHGLGLLLLAAGTPAALPEGEPPAWVADWLAKRGVAAEKRVARATEPGAGPDSAQQARRAEKRLALVRHGLEGLDLWLCDLVRNGLASLEGQPATLWEAQAARLVDAQAPGVAARVRRLAAIPGSSPDWPARLLARLGRLSLLIQAFGRIESLDAALQDDVRGLIGWTLKEDAVVARGETVSDRWVALGQWVEDEERVRTQRTWLQGIRSGRSALVLQFSAAGAPFGQMLVPGSCLEAGLSFWPSAYPQRALIRERLGAPNRLQDHLPGAPTIDAFLAGVAQALARQPWLDRFPCALNEVVPIYNSTGPWQIRDRAGAVLPLSRGDHWRLLALSGGAPLDLAAEWDGDGLLPLGAVVDRAYYPLWEAH